MNDIPLKCKATIKRGTNKGKSCEHKAKFGEYCGFHNPSKDKDSKDSKESMTEFLKILPNNLSSILGNATYEGLLKIKKIIIENWLKTHSKEELVEGKIPISKKIYDELLPKFNGETVVITMIFIIHNESKDSKSKDSKSKESEIKFSHKMPLFPINSDYYKFLNKIIPNDNVKRDKNYLEYKTFIHNQWLGLNEKIHNGKIYIKKSIYQAVKTYIAEKISKYIETDKSLKINVLKWVNFIMEDLFVTNEIPRRKTPSPKRYKPKSHSPVPRKVFSIPKKIDINQELKNLFPDKDIELYLKVISVHSDVYAKNINSKREIHELYLQFHPDKCNSSDEKVVKLCNLFCSKVENIKKCFERNTKKDVAHSPIIVRGNELKDLEKLL